MFSRYLIFDAYFPNPVSRNIYYYLTPAMSMFLVVFPFKPYHRLYVAREDRMNVFRTVCSRKHIHSIFIAIGMWKHVDIKICRHFLSILPETIFLIFLLEKFLSKYFSSPVCTIVSHKDAFKIYKARKNRVSYTICI